MAAGMVGADPKKVAAAAAVFARKAQRMGVLSGDLNRLVVNEAAWSGPDADAFRAAWSKQRAVMDAAAQQLVGLQRALSDNAEQQQSASAN